MSNRVVGHSGSLLDRFRPESDVVPQELRAGGVADPGKCPHPPITDPDSLCDFDVVVLELCVASIFSRLRNLNYSNLDG